MMALWFAEVRRLHNKDVAHTPMEEFFLDLTIEFDRARNAGAPDDYLNWLLAQIDLYLSGNQDQAMANVLTAAGKAASKAVGNEVRWNA